MSPPEPDGVVGIGSAAATVPPMQFINDQGEPVTAPTLFLHYGSRTAITQICGSGTLQLSRTVGDAVFAAPVGGACVPAVQHSRDGSRDTAVLFRAEDAPDVVFPEEAMWRRTRPLPIKVVSIMDAATADTLLDGTAGIDDAGCWPHR